jgi:hypothetical protein
LNCVRRVKTWAAGEEGNKVLDAIKSAITKVALDTARLLMSLVQHKNEKEGKDKKKDMLKLALKFKLLFDNGAYLRILRVAQASSVCRQTHNGEHKTSAAALAGPVQPRGRLPQVQRCIAHPVQCSSSGSVREQDYKDAEKKKAGPWATRNPS